MTVSPPNSFPRRHPTASAQAFQPRPWLRNGHLQTIVGNYLPRVDNLPLPSSERVFVPLPEQMRALPWAVEMERAEPSSVLCHCHWQPDRERAATAVLVHGLQGSSSSQYILGNANKLWQAGCNVIRMNMRNCGDTAALSPTLYHSGMSGDIVAVLQWAVAQGSAGVVLVGYSMGGNLVLKAAGELGADAPPQLAGVVAVSPPMDLAESADALHEPWNRVYEWRFLRGLRTCLRRKAKLFPAIYRPAALHGVHSIRDYDEQVTAPWCGFAGANDYYFRSSAARVMDRIAVPALVLHALDDPFIRLTAATRASILANPWIELLEPEHGGHCAFLQKASATQDGYWAEEQVLRFTRWCTSATADGLVVTSAGVVTEETDREAAGACDGQAVTGSRSLATAPGDAAADRRPLPC